MKQNAIYLAMIAIGHIAYIGVVLTILNTIN